MKFFKFNYKNFFLSFGLGFIIFLFITWLILQLTAPRIPLLGFHGILDSKTYASKSVPAEMEYPKQELEKFLEYLVQNNYWFLSTQELYEYFLTKSKEIPTEHLNQKPIMISFDDGYKTVYTNLIPILDKLEQKYSRKVKVVLFVNPGTLATAKSIASTHLGCKELRAGLKKGFYDIQSHGLNHKNLTKISTQDLIEELLQAQTELRVCTEGLDPDKKVGSHLAYPYGAYNKQVEKYASKYYLSSYLYNSRILKYCWLKNYYEIPRLTVNRGKPASKLIKMAQRSHQIKKKEKC
jgi:peptidoglycan/xylan/chitin deacetylase (PgdA/CDA1 family)